MAVATRRRRGRALGALAPAVALGTALALGPGSAATAAGTVCDTETYQWTGSATLGAGVGAASTGVAIPAIAGTDLIAVGASADGVAADGTARPLEVLVGDRLVQQGAVLSGGEISVRSAGDEPVTVSGASVLVDRCHLVESAALPSTPPAPRRVARPATLPATGAATVPIVVVGLVVASLGLVLRRAAGADRRA